MCFFYPRTSVGHVECFEHFLLVQMFSVKKLSLTQLQENTQDQASDSGHMRLLREWVSPIAQPS